MVTLFSLKVKLFLSVFCFSLQHCHFTEPIEIENGSCYTVFIILKSTSAKEHRSMKTGKNIFKRTAVLMLVVIMTILCAAC